MNCIAYPPLLLLALQPYDNQNGSFKDMEIIGAYYFG